MPFHLRTVQPIQVSRLGGIDGQRYGQRDGLALVFSSLEEVSVHSMVRIIQQLSDLSRLAEDIFSSIHGQAVTLGKRSAYLQRRLASLHHFVSHLDHRKVPVPVSNLDEESKWTVHYTASWHQQENVFLPSSRPPCVEDLHKEAKVNLKTVLRECDKLRRDGYRSSQYYSQGPTFSSSPDMVCTSYPEEEEEYSRKFSVSSNEEERLLMGKRPKTPVPHEFSDTHTNWTKSLPLPTPEEKMRQEAQAIQTDVVPINVTAGTGQIGFRGHSMYIPESYDALDNVEPCLSPSKHSETRDFSCQTEEIKVVPPSVRRIRAQKGQGIAALMSSSSGNMSTLSDPAGCTQRPNGDLHFRSLPRTGARVCLQSLDQRTESSRRIEDSFITLPRQLSKLQVDDSVVHLRSNHKTGTLSRPKSQEVRGSEREVFSNPACVVSPHASYSTSVIPNAMLSSSSEVIAINTTQTSGQLESKQSSHGSSSHSKSMSREPSASGKSDHHFCGPNWSENSSMRNSQASDALSPGAVVIINLSDHKMSLNNTGSINNGPQTTPYRKNDDYSHPHDSDTHSESSYSDGRQRNGSITSSINSADQWPCEMRENDSNVSLKKASSAVSGSPVSNMSTCSSERKADSSSVYSLDHDGYYTSMHMDSGIGSGNHREQSGIQNPRHSAINIYDKKDTQNQDDRSSYSDKSLTRSISLKKPKKPPPPPSRTDSLRRPPKRDLKSNGQVLNETLIATLQQSLQLNLKSKSGSSPSQSPCSDYEDPWVLRSRSQSTVSASSSGLSATASNMYSICPITPSQSETSSIKSEYADQWSYYIDEQPKSTLHSPKKSVHSSEQHLHSGLPKQIHSSPEKPCRVTSPSSGYSSQSNTPTNLTPVPLLLRSMSPGSGKNKIKPKVPERRSSLISSVSISSSSTSLSSNTSDSAQQTVKTTTMVMPSSPTPPLTPDPPPPPMISVVDNDSFPSSPHFPPPPPEATVFLSLGDNLWLSHSVNTDKSTQEAFPPPALPPPPPPFPTLHSKAALKVSPSNTETLKLKNYPLPQRNKNSRLANPQNNPPNKQELKSPTAPLITAQALQMVQLRSVKNQSQPEAENIAEQVLQQKILYKTPPLFSRPSSVPSVSSDLSNSKSIRENKNLNLQDEQLQCSDSPNKSARFENTNHGCREKEYQDSAHNGDKTMLSEMSSPQERASTSQSPPSASPNKKPPPVSKKPKLFLIVPPPQLDLAGEKIAQVNENVRSMPKASEEDSVSEHCEEVNGRIAEENSLEESASLNCQAGEETVSYSKLGEDITIFNLSPALDSPNHQEEEEQPTMSNEASVPDGRNGSTNCNQKIFQDDETGDVFETKPSSSPLLQTNRFDGSEEVSTPTRHRTTEDLFAAIHRSKRKVLGRKDSDDDRCRNHSPSPPVTPTGGAPNVSSFKQPGAIQRGVRKSNTSNDNFKALLLKKGSRSECGFRMSAAEMLKHTDPRFQRPRSESSGELPDSPILSSPSTNKRAQEEWAKSEGVMPRSMSVSGTRYSRSRTPPSAASSKYNVRSRLQSSPMTVICEGDGEMADAVENSFTKTPLMSTMSLDRFQRFDSELNDSVGADSFSPRVHIDLMSRLSDVSPEKDNDSS